MTTVKEWLESLGNINHIIEKYGHLEIVEEYGEDKPFPQRWGNYGHIKKWALLSDGSALGWNVSPRTGSSFPRVGKRTVDLLRRRG